MVDFRSITKQQLDLTMPIITDFPWENPAAYAMWLSQTFYMVNHSTRLVALAGGYAPIDRNILHDRFVDHSKEERGHQLVCLADLKTMGYTIDQIPCLPASACMYQVQYYWIQFRGAASFFGYTLALEALAEYFGPKVFERITNAHGMKAAKFMRLHADADVGHLESAYKAMATLTPEEAEIARENLDLSSSLYREMLVKSKEFALSGRMPTAKKAA